MLEQSPMPVLEIPSLRDKVSPAEWQARVNLAASMARSMRRATRSTA